MKAIINRITFWYVIFYALYSISTRFMPTAILCEGPLAGILYKTVIIGGGILALLFLYSLMDILKKPDISLFLLGGFIIILGISTILNYKYELTENILGMATFTSQLIVFYFLPVLMPKEQLIKCIKRTALFTSILWTMGCIGSLYQYIENIHYTVANPENREIRQGIIDGRLFGLFSDPNFAAFTSLIIVLFLVFMIRHTKNKSLKIYGFISIFINVAYIIMSNSRTIYITAVGTILFAVIFITYNDCKNENGVQFKQFFKKICLRGIITVLGIAAVYSAIFFPMQRMGQAIKPEREVNDMVREDVNKENFTNNRSTIWKNYLELYKDQPVFGFSIRGALPYATEKYPGSYLAETQYVTHNGYISLLVETGVLGFGVMAAFFILTLIQSIKKVRQKEKVSECYIFCTSLTIAVLCFLMCFHDVFFTVNIETMFLFIAIGYIHNSNQTISSISARH